MIQEKTVSDYLRWAAECHPDRLAYGYAEEDHSWAQVDRRVDRLANALRAAGIRQGDVVASCCQDGPVLNEVLFAAARIGAIRVGVNYRFSPQDVAKQLQHCGAKLLVLQDSFRHLAAELPPDVRVVSCGDAQRDRGEYERMLEAARDRPVSVQVKETAVAQICYTTGSTGVPKGAVWTHRSLCHSIIHTLLDLGMTHDDAWLHCLPGAGVPSVLAVWNVALAFPNVVLKAFDPAAVLRAIEKYRVTRAVWVPTMLAAVCAEAEKGGYDASSLRRISYGSAPTPPALIRRALNLFPGVTFDQWYGSTEGAGGWFTQLTPADHSRAMQGEEHLLESCGKAMHHVHLKVVDEAGKPVRPGEIGEVCVRGAFLMREYFQAKDLTAAALKDGWLHTGDMGKLDAEGYLYLVDRKQFMIITGGYNVYPVEVENVLAAHPAVAEVCVFGIPDDKWGEAVHALVVPRPGMQPAADELRAWCQDQLAAFKVPKAIELRNELLRGPTGKILKRAHKEEFWKRKAA